MTYMEPGNAVRVTIKSDENYNKIGFIESKQWNNHDFVEVNFGTYTKQMNISSLLDITYLFNDVIKKISNNLFNDKD